MNRQQLQGFKEMCKMMSVSELKEEREQYVEARDGALKFNLVDEIEEWGQRIVAVDEELAKRQKVKFTPTTDKFVPQKPLAVEKKKKTSLIQKIRNTFRK